MFSGGGTGTLNEADQIFKDIELPDYEKSERELRNLLATEQITPEQYEAAKAEASGLTGYKGDPRLREAQLRALDELSGLSKTGMGATDKARIADIEREGARSERGAREAILQNARARGTGGSGMEIVSQLISGQGSADRAAQAGQDVAARAEQRALEALSQYGNMSGNIREQDFGEAERKAAATDTINRFNAANTNDAARYNATNRQGVQEANANRAFDTQYGINDLRRNRFQDDVTLAEGRTGVLTSKAQMEEDRRKKGQAVLGDMVSGASAAKAAGGAGGAMTMFSDENLKKNITPGDREIEDFLEHLTVNGFEYKDSEKFGGGRYFGPMAQDLEKSAVGRTMVEETPEGKLINYGKGFGVMLSVMKRLSDRLKEVERARS